MTQHSSMLASMLRSGADTCRVVMIFVIILLVQTGKKRAGHYKDKNRYFKRTECVVQDSKTWIHISPPACARVPAHHFFPSLSFSVSSFPLPPGPVVGPLPSLGPVWRTAGSWRWTRPLGEGQREVRSHVPREARSGAVSARSGAR